MAVSLAQVLALDVVQRAGPQVAHGGHLLDRVVRWVHTSELVEAAALLKGGELLLTTGLGLSGRGPLAQQAYVDELANRGAAALVLELGWTFPEVPDALLQAARHRDLPLIALREIVPFVEITEQIQRQLLHATVGQLTLERDVNHLLHDLLLRGEGLTALTAAMARVLGCPVVVEEHSGAVVAHSGDGASPGQALTDGDTDVHSAAIEVLGGVWGRLHAVDPPAENRHLLPVVLESGAAAVALTLLRGPQPTSPRGRLRQEFVKDLLDGRFRGPAELVAGGSLVGFIAVPHATFTGFAIAGHDPEDAQVAVNAAETAAAECGDALVAEVDGIVLGLIQGRQRDSQQLARPLLRAVDAYLRRRGVARPSRLALGPSVSGVEALGRTLRDARAALLLADELALPERTVTARGMVADRLLAKVVEDHHLADVIDDVLGPLLRHDAAHGSDLVETLRLYLSHGATKSTAAEILHIRRQTLYKRLARIEALVGDIEDPEWRVSLLVALKAHELLLRRRPA